MGLLNRILNEKTTEPEKDGLLKKAEDILSEEEKAFRILLNRLNVVKAALFSLDKNFYTIQYSCGLEEDSVHLSKSTKDFWDGLNLTFDFVFKTGEDLNPFYQFFSEKDKINLTGLYITKLHSQDILLLPVYNERIIENILEIKEEITSFLNNDIDFIIKSSLSHGNKALLLILSKENNFSQYEIDSIKQTVASKDLFSSDENIIKLVLFTQSEIDIDLYKIQLLKTLKLIDEEIHLEQINIESAGYCSTLQGIKTFISKEL